MSEALDQLDTKDLLIHLTCQSEDLDHGDALDEFEERYEIEWDQAQLLISALIPLAMCAQEPLAGKVYQGFAKDGVWLVKRPMQSGESE